jgi:hypothetical protein
VWRRRRGLPRIRQPRIGSMGHGPESIAVDGPSTAFGDRVWAGLSGGRDILRGMPITSSYDRDRVAHLLREQYDVITRSQALECGMSPGVVDYRVRNGGPWRIVLPGVYQTVTGTSTPAQRDVAALLYAGPRSVLTGPVAVRRHHLNCAGLNLIDVLIPADTCRKSTGSVQIQRTTRMPRKVWEIGPIRFAPPCRAVADAARQMSRFSDVQAVVCEAVQRKSCTLQTLIRELSEGPSAGSRGLRTALAELGAGVRSSAEADLKHLIDRSDLEKPMYNPMLYDAQGTYLGQPDAWWQRAGVAGEVDSREYHLSAEDYDKTTTRHNRMEARGINVLHWLPSTIKTRPVRVLDDLRAALNSGHLRPPLPITAVPAAEA